MLEVLGRLNPPDEEERSDATTPGGKTLSGELEIRCGETEGKLNDSSECSGTTDDDASEDSGPGQGPHDV